MNYKRLFIRAGGFALGAWVLSLILTYFLKLFVIFCKTTSDSGFECATHLDILWAFSPFILPGLIMLSFLLSYLLEKAIEG